MSPAPTIEISIGGIHRELGPLQGEFSRQVRLSIPPELSPDTVRMAQVDLEILARKLRESSSEIKALLDGFLAGENSEVERLVRELALTEADFQAAGGGLFWAVVIVGVLCCASEAY